MEPVLTSRIVRAAHLVDAFYQHDPGSAERAAVFRELAPALHPVELMARSEPISVFAGLLEEIDQHGDLRQLLAGVLPRVAYSPGALCHLIDALAGARLSDEIIGFRLLDHLLASEIDKPQLDRALAAVCSILARSGSTPIISFLERLRIHGAQSRAATLAALRGIAMWEPSFLGAAFAMVEPEVNAELDDLAVDDLRFQIHDLIARAGVVTVLRAFGRIEPAKFEGLVRAGFSGQDAPFRIVRLYSVHDFQDCRILVQSGRLCHPLEDMGLGQGGLRWSQGVMQIVPALYRTEGPATSNDPSGPMLPQDVPGGPIHYPDAEADTPFLSLLRRKLEIAA